MTDWSFGLHIFDRLLLVVAFGIWHLSDAYNKQRLFEASVTVCKQYIAQYCGDSDNHIKVSKSHRTKSKIVAPCSAQTI